MYQVLAYLRYWLRSGNAHGLHSPFIYGLYTTVICHNGAYNAFGPIEERRRELLQSTQRIAVTDFGAGSQVAGAGGHERQLRDIARHAAKPPRLAQLLFRLVNHFQPATGQAATFVTGKNSVYFYFA